jgi:23S rRNA (guanine745-N1)-methyltransferase
MPALRCTVRGCAQALSREGPAWRCGRGHAFDVARAGFVNLLQPQDKKAGSPGDTKEVVEARRRLLDAGVAAPLTTALLECLARLAPGASVIDIGCGEGTHLAAIAAARRVDGCGVDLSVPAIEAAAKRHKALCWVVANADRGLPFAEGAIAAALSITGRRDAAELARVLAPGGLAVIAIPAPDDLAELREAVQGAAHEEDRLEKVRAELTAAGAFRETATRTVTHRIALDRDRIADVLATTYRGARKREREKAAALEAMDVTFSWRVAVFERL